jgi:enoyl-CoA hydratase
MDKKIFSEIKEHIGIIWLNRPEKKNALNDELWFALPELVKELDDNEEVRVIILAAKGDTFSAGIDINTLVEAFELNEDLRTSAEDRLEVMKITKKFQDAFTTIAKTKKPTIAAIQGYSIGGATNMVAACDIRLSTKDAKFSIGESKLGLVADVGALQRMPKIISKGLLRELAYTGKTFEAEHAKEIGFVNHIFDTHEELINGAIELAKDIASNSPLVVKGVKMILDKGEELTVDQSLDLVRMWSTSFLVSEDLKEGIYAMMEKREPKFKDK